MVNNIDFDKMQKFIDDMYDLDKYERYLRKSNSERVIKIYVNYLSEAAEYANDRNKYKHLMPYLKKLQHVLVEFRLLKTLQKHGDKNINEEVQ